MGYIQNIHKILEVECFICLRAFATGNEKNIAYFKNYTSVNCTSVLHGNSQLMPQPFFNFSESFLSNEEVKQKTAENRIKYMEKPPDNLMAAFSNFHVRC